MLLIRIVVNNCKFYASYYILSAFQYYSCKNIQHCNKLKFLIVSYFNEVFQCFNIIILYCLLLIYFNNYMHALFTLFCDYACFNAAIYIAIYFLNRTRFTRESRERNYKLKICYVTN